MKTTRTYPAKCSNCNGTGIDYKQIDGYNTSSVCIVCNGQKTITITEIIESDDPPPLDVETETATYEARFDMLMNARLQELSLTDGEIEKEANLRYGEITGGQYQAARPHDIALFQKGAKWVRNKLTGK